MNPVHVLPFHLAPTLISLISTSSKWTPPPKKTCRLYIFLPHAGHMARPTHSPLFNEKNIWYNRVLEKIKVPRWSKKSHIPFTKPGGVLPYSHESVPGPNLSHNTLPSPGSVTSNLILPTSKRTRLLLMFLRPKCSRVNWSKSEVERSSLKVCEASPSLQQTELTETVNNYATGRGTR
jgi:hypothetical protein